MKLGVTLSLLVFLLLALPTSDAGGNRNPVNVGNDAVEINLYPNYINFNGWKKLSECIAERRTTDFIGSLVQWQTAKNQDPVAFTTKNLKGGKSKCQTTRGS